MAIVMGVPNRVKRYRIAARMCNWATRRSKSRSAQPFFGTYSIPMPNRRPSTNTLALEKEGVEREPANGSALLTVPVAMPAGPRAAE
jgi:hypothetical protein